MVKSCGVPILGVNMIFTLSRLWKLKHPKCLIGVLPVHGYNIWSDGLRVLHPFQHYLSYRDDGRTIMKDFDCNEVS